MADMDHSGLRHRAVTEAPKVDNNKIITAEVENELPYPVVPPNSPVDAQPAKREYLVSINANTGKDELHWIGPRTPYTRGIEVTERKPAEPVNLGTILSIAAAPLNAINTLVYIGLLFANAKSFASAAFMFAIAQLSENCKSLGLLLVKPR